MSKQCTSLIVFLLKIEYNKYYKYILAKEKCGIQFVLSFMLKWKLILESQSNQVFYVYLHILSFMLNQHLSVELSLFTNAFCWYGHSKWD